MAELTDRYYPQIKICGLTRADQAQACAQLGADAVGLVFYEKSPRNVTPEQASAITAALPAHVAAVGVFVDPDPDALIRTVGQCGLDVVQLHGKESPAFVAELKERLDTRIIKALFAARPPNLTEAHAYDVDGYLVECGKGRLPGGNAEVWSWAEAQTVGRQYPLVLAGGLGPENVDQAIAACLPDAVDASSAIETTPGIKDLQKVARFIERIRDTSRLYRERGHHIRLIL